MFKFQIQKCSNFKSSDFKIVQIQKLFKLEKSSNFKKLRKNRTSKPENNFKTIKPTPVKNIAAGPAAAPADHYCRVQTGPSLQKSGQFPSSCETRGLLPLLKFWQILT
jgi:hypothetical protein